MNIVASRDNFVRSSEMKFSIRLCGIAVLSMSLMACTIGNGRICGPQTPRAYCDKEAYQKLLHPKAYGEYWVKTGMTKESWREDWVGCGGYKDGDFSPHVRDINTLVEQGLSQSEAREKLKDSLKSCMQSRGYEYLREP